MATFDSDGVTIHYEQFGDRALGPVVLVHGFASSLDGNWVRTGWVDTFTPLRRVVALDCRGHGESEKPYDPEAYGDKVPGDVVRLMDHLDIQRADLFGYSMGGRISLRLMVEHPERFHSVVLGGVGEALAGSRRNRPNLAAGMLASDASEIDDPVAKGFRIFAEAGGNDLKALAASVQAEWSAVTAEDLARVDLPVLIAVGEQDVLAGSADGLARAIPGAELLTVPEREHLTVVPDQRFKDAVVRFLRERSPA